MKFIHHNTGEWVRPDWHTATRTDPIVTEYNKAPLVTLESSREVTAILDAIHRSIASGKPAVLNVMVEGLAAPTLRRPVGA